MKPLTTDQTAWLDALLSGKYARTNSRLGREFSDGMRHCCLGVFCAMQPNVEWVCRTEFTELIAPVLPGSVDLSLTTNSSAGLWLSDMMGARLDLSASDQSMIGGQNDQVNALDLTFAAVIPTILRVYADKGYDVSAYETYL